MFDDIDFSPGIVTYNGTDDLDQEDIFQVIYIDGNNYTLDVGWYPTLFKVVAIKDYDWDNPVLMRRCTDSDLLHAFVQECAEYVSSMI
ncbi:hypothetical protein I6N90_05255 [Paenibacillus sp. GSMTC-2017]|uniref:hypothetical protein n=1 Tax=Paenibacillus sp. GSMTC-2017 TaxID=2794350 RepID=UPI0018D61C03|nr:hypothetical protein [Paenibacillus sp. GSMTC-2017]MBH5317216.1 hypothetical protein [Paenibacillus sp. GSMTC-2017]